VSFKQKIIKDVRKWSELFLEVPNKHLGGMPACPFAKKTWKEKNVLVKVKPKNKWYKSQLNNHLDSISFNKVIGENDGYDLLIFCDPFFNYSTDDFQDVIDDYNDWYNSKDLFFMGFHPANPANIEEQEFLVSPSGNKMPEEKGHNYSMLLIQKFSLLQEASGKLHKAGYYNKWPKGYYRDVVVSRRKTYKRIFGG
tara:strand:+ start:466 stop:1053 length:588 start_codon:yes stop_codon:yes gene_type:complete